MQSNACGYITIFHDYEGSYALPGKEEASYYGVTRLLDLEKQYNIKATYNVVGRLFDDHPEIINRIIDEGHDLASHSFDHKVITDLSKKQIDIDIEQSKTIFRKLHRELQGFRAPQSRWSFALMRSMLDNGLKWSAENDKADFPYIIFKNGKNEILRLPIKMDDWDYKEKKISPEQMRQKSEAKVKDIKGKRCYGAIGFHPWVQGEDEERLFQYERFLSGLKTSNSIKILTFQEVYIALSSGE